MQIVACLTRIQKYFLNEPSSKLEILITSNGPKQQAHADLELDELPRVHTSDSDALFLFKNATVHRSVDSPPVLQEVDLSISTVITAIIGPTGSGKSTLLESLLGTTFVTKGSVTSSVSKIAYCSQIPWIQNKTIRKNIIGDLDFDQKWYDYTISVCMLEEDLKTLMKGDMHKTGSNGESLSGGQRQRVVRKVTYSLDTANLV